ncbi:MAG: FAD:protein FMN transferase, partial [Rhizobiales bacterium]|nr:FAD:protein FMN transferase [Hyphomicrobiales bacterium]
PGTSPVKFQRIIAPGTLALATSGTLTNGFRQGYRHANHIIDPRRKRPVDNNIASVSVLAATAMRADALATALIVMGMHDGVKLAERENISALFLTGNGPKFTVVMTGSFAKYVLI